MGVQGALPGASASVGSPYDHYETRVTTCKPMAFRDLPPNLTTKNRFLCRNPLRKQRARFGSKQSPMRQHSPILVSG